MRLTLLSVYLGFGAASLLGQCGKVDTKAEEAKIRELVKTTRPVYTGDVIRWSGAEKRPSVGAQRGEAFPGAKLDKRRNSKTTSSVQRVEVAACGDMAWLYSTGTLEYDLDETPMKHIAFERAELAVLKKIDGQWKVAAMFTRPIDRPFVTAEEK
jgi:ketosteroid isomerase-like protein